MGSLGLPNIITLSRLFAIPFISYFYLKGDFGWAFALLSYAGFSDVIDGGLARWMGHRTKLGAILDPAADKLLMLVAFTTLAVSGEIPYWLAALVVFRDVYIVFGIFVLKFKSKKVYIRPTYISKMSTFFQLSLLFAFFAHSYVVTTTYSWAESAAIFFHASARACFYLTIVFTIASGVHYTLVGMALYRGKLHEGAQ